jgi:hypothetical protein
MAAAVVGATAPLPDPARGAPLPEVARGAPLPADVG